MKRIGIVCEYNPLHTGHAALLKRARAMGDAVVCVMSGNLVQRGEAAITDKYARAEATLSTGADLVLELPFPYAMSGASFFAAGGVATLASVGVDTILFGSECGELSRLERAADALADTPKECDREKGSAVSHFDRLSSLTDGESFSSNDILGIEYIRAIRAGGYRMTPTLMKRLGDGYRETSLGASEYASATAIRGTILSGNGEGTATYLPPAMQKILARETECGRAPATLGNLERAILFFWRTADPASLSSLAELGGGLAERLSSVAGKARTLDELYTLAATKKYTNAHIRRAILYGMLGVRWEDLESAPAYTNLLAANGKGRELLASLRRGEQAVPVLTKPSDVDALCDKYPARAEAIRRAHALSARADALYSLALPSAEASGHWLSGKPFLAMGVDADAVL